MKKLSLPDRTSRSGTFLVLLALLAGCAPQAREHQRFFWPMGGGQPRIEYIGFLQTEQDARQGDGDWLADALLGTRKPQKLFNRPHDVASDGGGRVFVTDAVLREVFVFDFVREEVRTLRIPDRPRPPFKFPGGLTVDAAGRVYVTDSQEAKVYLFGADEKPLKSFGAGQLSRPTGLAVDSARQRLYVVDTGAHRVAVFDPEGGFLGTIGERGGEPGQFNFPADAEVDAAGNLYVLDALNARVQVFDPAGRFLRSFGERGTALGSFRIAKAIAVSPSGHVYVTDSMANRFVIFDLQGRHLLTVGGEALMVEGKVSPGGFYLPQGIDVDENDAIWIVDALNGLVHRYQYLNARYLSEHPILPGQGAAPSGY